MYFFVKLLVPLRERAKSFSKVRSPKHNPARDNNKKQTVTSSETNFKFSLVISLNEWEVKSPQWQIISTVDQNIFISIFLCIQVYVEVYNCFLLPSLTVFSDVRWCTSYLSWSCSGFQFLLRYICGYCSRFAFGRSSAVGDSSRVNSPDGFQAERSTGWDTTVI